MYRIRLVEFAILASFCFGYPVAQDEGFVYTGPTNTQFLHNYRQNPSGFANHQELTPFRQTSGFHQIDSYLPQRDLQTSDLPYHLQQTLPQYHITTKAPQFPFQFHNSPPTPFRSQNIIPSTHRPNYSHLFSHNRNPQTETFLGEITLQNPPDLPPQFNSFKPSTFSLHNSQNRFQGNVDQNLDFTEKPKSNDNTVQLGSKAHFLNHRSRIFAPDLNNSGGTQIRNYFVNNNGDVFVTTKSPLSPTTTIAPTSVQQAKPTYKPLTSNKKIFVSKYTTPKNSFNLESLLEEPIKNSQSNNDDYVEVIKSVTTTESNTSLEETTQPVQVSTDYEYESSEFDDYPEDAEEVKREDNNDIKDEDHLDNSDPEKSTKINSNDNAQNSSNYDIVTIKPSSVNKEDNFQDFVDDTKIDNTTEEPVENTETPIILMPFDLENETSATNLNNSEPSTSVSMSTSVNIKTQKVNNPESVVSVVTTKSVVNNTVIATSTPIPLVTEQVTHSTNEDNTTDTWVVVASVQTSRSVSGARYLPSSIVEQEERVKLLNEDSKEENAATDENQEFTTVPPTTKQKTSTESLIDKLDRVQSDLSSGLLTGGFKNEGNNIAVIRENMTDKTNTTTMLDLAPITSTEPTTLSTTTKTTTTTKSAFPAVQIRKFQPHARPANNYRSKKVFDNIKQDDVSSLLPAGFKPKYQNRKTTTTTTVPLNLDEPQGDEPLKESNLAINNRITNKTKIEVQDVRTFLPAEYKHERKDDNNSKLVDDIIKKFKQSKSTSEEGKNETKLIETVKEVDISAFLPPDYKLSDKPKNKTSHSNMIKNSKQDDISAFLPPGYKTYKTTSTTEKSKVDNILAKAKPVDVSALLPPGYKPPKETITTNSKNAQNLLNQAKPVDISAFLPPGYKSKATQKPETGTKAPKTTPEITKETTSTSAKPPEFKVVFPSRPGGGIRKPANRLTTSKPIVLEENKATVPAIHKGWPSRATTEFTGWPTPSTTPISIEKLLEAARLATSSSTLSSPVSTTSTTVTTTTTTTTTPKPTTPGICVGECDLAGTIKLVGGAKWVPELLDRNTKEWQILANEVQSQLEDVFSRSNVLNKWYKKIRIDGFSEGSVLVDYLVELNDLGRQIDTVEIKKLFHNSLDDALENISTNREGKSLNETAKLEGKLSLGNFIVDPKYTDFIVLPKQVIPTVGYADDNVLLPQWAIAVIVIGLASLLFVIIFGVTVLVNRQKNSKKKTPTPLTEDMLNELNKNHMGGLDNYGAEDLYNMEDVWNDRGYETKPPKKRSSGSIHDNSMSNLYDSWRSEWNGYYYNAYYGNNPGSSHGGYGRRRSDYDTNF